MLHGHTLPSRFTKVMIEQVFDPQAKLHVGCYLGDDEQCLQQNMITAWKNDCKVALTISRNGPERTRTPHYFTEQNGRYSAVSDRALEKEKG